MKRGRPKKEKKIVVTVRLTESEYVKLRQEADREFRSLGGQIMWLIAQADLPPSKQNYGSYRYEVKPE